MKNMTENEVGEYLLMAVSACRKLADDSSGALSLDDKNMCSMIAYKLTNLFNNKLTESRNKMSTHTYIPPKPKKSPLIPIVQKIRDKGY